MRVLNETVESFDTMPVEITLESVDGQTSMALNVYTSQERYWQLPGGTGTSTRTNGRISHPLNFRLLTF